MEVELEWIKITEIESEQDIRYFFLARFSSKIKGFYNSFATDVLREVDTVIAIGKAKKSFALPCNLHSTPKMLFAPLSSLKTRRGKQEKKMVLTKKENRYFSILKQFETVFHVFLTSSLSFFKKTYPQYWKTIFVDLLKKSNLLVRSDNNTGLSLLKVLQTTTI